MRTTENGAGIIVEEAKAKAQSGNLWTHTYSVSLDTAEEQYIFFETPAATIETAALKAIVSSGKSATVILTENATIDPAGEGDPIAAENNNRSSSNTLGTLVYSDPTDATDGTTIEAFEITAGLNAVIGGISEWILKPSTKYFIKLTSNADGNLCDFNIYISKMGAM